MTLAWVQVSPDRYHSTGTGPFSACGGTKTAKVIGQPVVFASCRYTPWTPPWERAFETVSMG